MADLTRPIIGIENRTAQEVFDIMCDRFRRASPSQVAPANPAQVMDAQIEHMVQQFLRWKLPEDFNPDGGISFDPIMNLGTEHQSRREPIGTNLFDYRQAKAMVQHMLDGLAAIGAGGQAVADDATISEMVRAYNRTTDYIFPQATDKEQREAMRAVYATLFQRTCTCHPDDSPPSPCAEKYALSECRNSADERVVEALRIAEERLSSLLARIHRDGGHYEAAHGTEKAWTDADEIIARIYADDTHPAHSPAALASNRRGE